VCFLEVSSPSIEYAVGYSICSLLTVKVAALAPANALDCAASPQYWQVQRTPASHVSDARFLCRRNDLNRILAMQPFISTSNEKNRHAACLDRPSAPGPTSLVHSLQLSLSTGAKAMVFLCYAARWFFRRRGCRNEVRVSLAGVPTDVPIRNWRTSQASIGASGHRLGGPRRE